MEQLDRVLSLADGEKKVRGLKFILETGAALVVDDDVGFVKPIVVIILALGGLGESILPLEDLQLIIW